MFNYSELWEKRVITNVRLVGNQSRSCLMVLCLELGRHLQSHEWLQGSTEVVFYLRDILFFAAYDRNCIISFSDCYQGSKSKQTLFKGTLVTF